jgi:hypothetical protein
MKKEKSMLEIAKQKKKGFSFVDDGKGTKVIKKNRGLNGKNINRKSNK